MKKAFSLVEVIISVAILSFVMITLLQMKSNNIFLLEKSNEKTRLVDYILLAGDIENSSKQTNKSVYLDNLTQFKNDDIRREIKEVKIEIKDKELDKLEIKIDGLNIKIKTYVREYKIEEDIKKSLYSWEFEF